MVAKRHASGSVEVLFGSARLTITEFCQAVSLSEGGHMTRLPTRVTSVPQAIVMLKFDFNLHIQHDATRRNPSFRKSKNLFHSCIVEA
jgi:hypothetical protein